MSDKPIRDEVQTAADLGRLSAAADTRLVDFDRIGVDHVVAHLTRDDETLDVEDLERYADRPRTQRGTATLHQVASFIEYLTRHYDLTETTVWANLHPQAGPRFGDAPPVPTLTAVFNDHEKETDAAGWRDHTAVLRVPRDRDWLAWVGMSERPLSQREFADFVEDHLHNVVDPPAVRLIPAITTFTAKKNVVVESSTVLRTGQIQLNYIEDIEEGAKGDLTLPQEITLSLTPFAGEDPVEVKASLRFRLPRSANDGLTLAYRIVRPDQVEDEAFERICANVIENGPSVPLLYGPAPASLRG